MHKIDLQGMTISRIGYR